MDSPGSGNGVSGCTGQAHAGVRPRHCKGSVAEALLWRGSKGRGSPVRWIVSLFLFFLADGSFAAVHDYRVSIAPDLETVRVEGRVADPALRLTSPRGRLRGLSDLQTCNGVPVQASGTGFRADRGCFRYSASLRGTAARSWGRHVPRFAGHESWLWLPTLHTGDVVKITLELPPATCAVLPWRKIAPREYELRRSPGSGEAVAWFGPCAAHALEVDGLSLPLALLDTRFNPVVITAWLEEAASLVAAVGGRFPNPNAQVVIAPGDAGLFDDSPVPFGHVIRSGEEVVRFFVKPQATAGELREDWTAVHEFSHLLLPYVRDDQKWISEGFASYYQNVLMARGGLYAPEAAWDRLQRSITIAERTPRPPSLNDAHTRSFWDVRMLIYWSGAAIALMADVELRRTSAGRQTLDTVLGSLSDCCLPSPEVWEGRELFMKLDELAGRAVFVPLYDKYANTPGMPPVGPLFERLGIKKQKQGVRLDAAAPLAGIRDSIMRSGSLPVPVSAGTQKQGAGDE